ncbi:TPA: conjugal transfer pilus assembly protein TraU [Aeromonas veronii]
MSRSLWLVVLFCCGLLAMPARAASVECKGNFVNPVSDICWECIFPISIGSIAVSPGIAPDTPNPASPIQICPMGVLYRVGLAIGYWEPMALTDVTRAPYCLVNMGGISLGIGKVGSGTSGQSDRDVAGGFFHVHWYKYPLTYWLNIITSVGCLQGGDMDIGYLSELDPTWNDSAIGLILSPEAILFGNIIAQGACAADAIASSVGKPIDALFWCAGAHGSMYPFSGYTSDEFSPIQSSILLSERMAFKLHRQGMIRNSVGKDKAVCFEYPSAIVPKTRWRYQMVNVHPDVAACHPFGRTTSIWEAGNNMPNDRKNFGYLLWRKRNCVFL